MKKAKVLFVLALFVGILISAGGGYASTFLSQDLDPVKFWAVDDNSDPAYNDQQVAITGSSDAFEDFTQNDDDNFATAPTPSSALLLASGVFGLIGFGVRRRRNKMSSPRGWSSRSDPLRALFSRVTASHGFLLK